MRGADFINCCLVNEWGRFGIALSCRNGSASCIEGRLAGPAWGHIHMAPATLDWFLRCARACAPVCARMTVAGSGRAGVRACVSTGGGAAARRRSLATAATGTERHATPRAPRRVNYRWVGLLTVHWYKATREAGNSLHSLLDEAPLKTEMGNLAQLVAVARKCACLVAPRLQCGSACGRAPADTSVMPCRPAHTATTRAARHPATGGASRCAWPR
jgi:hypothetical protein